MSDKFQPSNWKLLDSLPTLKKVSDNFLPSAFTPVSNQKCLTTYGSPQKLLKLKSVRNCSDWKVSELEMVMFYGSPWDISVFQL